MNEVIVGRWQYPTDNRLNRDVKLEPEVFKHTAATLSSRCLCRDTFSGERELLSSILGFVFLRWYCCKAVKHFVQCYINDD